jgi:hypothetical protein
MLRPDDGTHDHGLNAERGVGVATVLVGMGWNDIIHKNFEVVAKADLACRAGARRSSRGTLERDSFSLCRNDRRRVEATLFRHPPSRGRMTKK